MIQLGIVSPADTGLAPYQVKGDPVIALTAQLNRFAGRSLKVGTTCGARKYVGSAFPLQAVITDAVATAALIILYDRYQCVPLDTYSQQRLTWVLNGMNDAMAFVMANLNEITLTIAQVGDALGLSPATTGITEVDPNLKPKSKAGYYIGGALLAALIGLVAYNRRGL